MDDPLALNTVAGAAPPAAVRAPIGAREYLSGGANFPVVAGHRDRVRLFDLEAATVSSCRDTAMNRNPRTKPFHLIVGRLNYFLRV